MAMSNGRDDGKPMMDINTTPLIDVMLVLLIMFMIALPRTTHSLKIDLPQGPGPVLPKPNPIVNKVAVAANGAITWNGGAVDMLTLRQYLNQTMTMTPEPELQFQPDPEARYERVDETMAVIKHTGVTKLGFVGNEQYSGRF